MTRPPVRAGVVSPSRDRSFGSHPRGLAIIATTEAFDNLAFYGMMSMFVLYMVGELLLPGHIEKIAGIGVVRGVLEGLFGPMSTQALASTIFGFYAGFAYFLPVLGGLLGDRLFGQKACVVTGAGMMTIGHFLMAFDVSFFIALIFLILGCGLVRANASSQVGALYEAGDPRRADAFVIYNMGFNIGVFLSPLVCGTIGELYGWHYGFAAAGVSILIGLTIYVSGLRYLPPDRIKTVAAHAEKPRWEKGDGKTVGALLVVLAVVTTFLICANEVGNVYPLWVKKYVDRGAFGLQIPVTWFTAITAFFAALSPFFLFRFWQWQSDRGKEPEMLTKIALGCLFCAAAFAILAAMAFFGNSEKSVYWIWLLPFHLIFSLGYMFVWPVGLALFSRSAPPAITAMIMGIYFLSLFVANIIVGRLGALYEKMAPTEFWLMHAAIPASGAVLIFLFGRPLARVLNARIAKPAVSG